MDCTQIQGIIGKRLLFVGLESASWTPMMFSGVASFARSHNIDSLLVKVADGGNAWYGGIAGYRQCRDAVKAQGVGCVPWLYSYGNKFGALSAEITILTQYLSEDGVVCMDAEAEWNGQVTWATQLFGALRDVPGTFLVTTWANPVAQGWGDIVKALGPRVAAWLPQQYTNYLALCWSQFGDLGASCLVPVVDLSDDFGLNDPVAIAQAAHQQDHTAIALWYHATAMDNPGLTDAVLAAFPGNSQESDMPLQITDAAAMYYTEAPGATPRRWHCTDPKHDFDVIGGILDAYCQVGQSAIALFGLPCSDEIYSALPGGASFQVFERIVLVYDPTKAADSPVGAGAVYAMHLDGDTPGLRQLIDRAGLTITGQSVVPQSKIDDARATINAAISALQNAQQDLAPTEISVVA